MKISINSWLTVTIYIFAMTFTSCTSSDDWDDWNDFDALESDSEITLKTIELEYGLLSDQYTIDFFPSIPDHGEYISCITENEVIDEYNEYIDGCPNEESWRYNYLHLPHIDPTRETLILAKLHTVSPWNIMNSEVISYKYVEKASKIYLMQQCDMPYIFTITCQYFPHKDREVIYPLIINRPHVKSSDINMDIRFNSHALQLDFGIDRNLFTSNKRKYQNLKCNGCRHHR